MTEDQWMACERVEAMLTYLQEVAKVSRSPKGHRKLRLFACGCCRQIWRSIEDDRVRRLVELAEQLADGLAEPWLLAAAEAAATWAKSDADLASTGLSPMTHQRRAAAAVAAALHTAAKETYEAARLSSWAARCSVAGHRSTGKPNVAWNDHEKGQADLLRCIFGNPFRAPSRLPEVVLAWNDATVRRIAEGIYEERAFERMPILADALVDAGCEQEELIGHFRSEEKHVRGCWGVDLILGRS